MPHSLRMMDLASLTRGLEEFKRLDPEQKVAANRLATQAAVHRVEQVHRDVTHAERPGESRMRDREAGSDERRNPDGRQAEGGGQEESEACPPEADEGRVLDIKV